MAKKKVLVAIPNKGSIRTGVVEAVVGMTHDDRYDVRFDFTGSVPVDDGRNKMIKAFLESDENFEFLLFMDSDNPVFPEKSALDNVERDKDIIVYPTLMWKGSIPKLRRADPPMMWNTMIEATDGSGWIEDPNRGGFHEIDSGGTGCILIHRRVLEHPEMRPWFMREWNDDGEVTKGSDLLFCSRAKKLGFEVWADYERPCSHYKFLDLALVYMYMQRRDIAQLSNIGDNINTPEYWDEQWESRDARILPFYQHLCEFLAGKRVLDYGCGRGDLLAMLSETCDAEGYDISSVALDKCEERGLNVLRSLDEGKIPWGYDAIVMTQVLEHVDDDAGLLAELHERCGLVIYSVPHNCLPPAVEPEHRRVYTKGYARKITPHFRYVIDTGTHLIVFSAKDGVDCPEPNLEDGYVKTR